MNMKGVVIFLLMQIFFVIFGFALFFGLKEFKESRSTSVTDQDMIETAKKIAVPSEQKKSTSCNFMHWIGETAEGPVMQEALKEEGRPYRILPSGSIATMDYNPSRINLHIDEDGTINTIRCG